MFVNELQLNFDKQKNLVVYESLTKDVVFSVNRSKISIKLKTEW